MTWLKRIAIGVGIGAALAAIAAYVSLGAFLPWREEAEAVRLAELANVMPGQTVAEIGAGSGRFTVALARRIGQQGRMLSTELNPERRRDIQKRAEGAGLTNVTVIEATETSTGLPDACCDLVFLRSVYHHIGTPSAFAANVARALKPGGTLVIIDFQPGSVWFLDSDHGSAREGVIAEMRTAGFQLRSDIPDWSGPLWLLMFHPNTAFARARETSCARRCASATTTSRPSGVSK